jgi:hypothetical protein
MNLNDYRVLFIVVTAVLALLVASPAMSRMLVYPRTEFFTEMWILGPNHKAEGYPYNISRGQNYTVFLGIGNQLGYCAYYLVEVKFRNQTQPLPSSFGPVENRVASSLPSLFNITAFVADEQTWELPLVFSFDYDVDLSKTEVMFSTLTLNSAALGLGGFVTTWNSTRSVFFGNLLFELWLYNASASLLSYHGRFVDLKLNMTGY